MRIMKFGFATTFSATNMNTRDKFGNSSCPGVPVKVSELIWSTSIVGSQAQLVSA